MHGYIWSRQKCQTPQPDKANLIFPLLCWLVHSGCCSRVMCSSNSWLSLPHVVRWGQRCRQQLRDQIGNVLLYIPISDTGISSSIGSAHLYDGALLWKTGEHQWHVDGTTQQGWRCSVFTFFSFFFLSTQDLTIQPCGLLGFTLSTRTSTE